MGSAENSGTEYFGPCFLKVSLWITVRRPPTLRIFAASVGCIQSQAIGAGYGARKLVTDPPHLVI
jgi:hypothetical protein